MGSPTHSPLLPELAQLTYLEELLFGRYPAPPWQGIPLEWLAPGAFQSLTA